MRNLLFSTLILCAFSCAQEVDESARSLEERLLKTRIEVKYLDTLHKTESGLYYMIQAKGSGALVQRENYLYVRYSDLDFFYENYMWGNDENYNTVLMTSEEHVAKQLGVFSPTTYYGPVLWMAGVYSILEGIDEMVLTMREGDKRRIWLPSWLSSYGYTGSAQQYSVSTIHDVEVLRVVPDIEKFQIDSLESYRDKYYPGLDSLSYGFYKKTLVEGIGDTLTVGNRVSVRYIGRLLDHFIFDLNIADSAKRYNIYNSSNTYDALEGECQDDETIGYTNSDGTTGSLVKGFSKAIFNMKHNEEAVVFFISGLGYGTDKQGQIQPLSPLVFYIKVERTNFEEGELNNLEDT